MIYRCYVNPTIKQFESCDPLITEQLIAEWHKMIEKHKLVSFEYKPVFSWAYANDDFAENRITLYLTAELIDKPVDAGNYLGTPFDKIKP